jgi:hypothetical protein
LGGGIVSPASDKYDEMKRKLRKFKKLEMKIRFAGMNTQENRKNL